MEICHCLALLPDFEVFMTCDAYIHYLVASIYQWGQYTEDRTSNTSCNSVCEPLCRLVKRSLHAAARANRYGVGLALNEALSRCADAARMARDVDTSHGVREERSSCGSEENMGPADAQAMLTSDNVESMESLLQVALGLIQWDDNVINSSLCTSAMSALHSVVLCCRRDTHIVTMTMHLWDSLCRTADSVVCDQDMRNDMLRCVLAVGDLHITHRALIVLCLTVANNLLPVTSTGSTVSVTLSPGRSRTCMGDVSVTDLHESLIRLLLRIYKTYPLDPSLTPLIIEGLAHTVSFATACTLMWMRVVPLVYSVIGAFGDDHSVLLACLRLLVKITSLNVGLVEVFGDTGAHNGMEVLVGILRKCCSLMCREEYQDVLLEVLQLFYNVFAVETNRCLLLRAQQAKETSASDSVLAALIQTLHLATDAGVVVPCLQVLCRLASTDDLAVLVTKEASMVVLEVICDLNPTYLDTAVPAPFKSLSPHQDDSSSLECQVHGSCVCYKMRDGGADAVYHEVFQLLYRLSLVHCNAGYLVAHCVNGDLGSCVGVTAAVLFDACDVLMRCAEWVERVYGDHLSSEDDDEYELISPSERDSDGISDGMWATQHFYLSLLLVRLSSCLLFYSKAMIAWMRILMNNSYYYYYYIVIYC